MYGTCNINEEYTHAVFEATKSSAVYILSFLLKKKKEGVPEPRCACPDGPEPITRKKQTMCVVLMFAFSSLPSLLSIREFIPQSNYLRY